MSLTRRALLTGLPLLLAVPCRSQAQETWQPAAHALNHPMHCLGWWLTTPLTGTDTWRDLLHQRVGTLTNMALGSSATSGLQRRTSRLGGWGHVAFDGVSDHVVLPDLPQTPAAISVSLWFRTAADGVNQLLIGRNQHPSGANPGWYLLINDTPAGSLGWWIQSNGDTAYAGLQGTVSVVDDRWHHVCAMAAGSGSTWSIGLWLDGRPAPADLITALPIGSVTTATLPRLGQTGDGREPFVGAMDDVRLYAWGLTEADARLLYADSRLGYPTLLAPGPQVAYAPAPPLPSVKLRSLFFSP